jgi:uncharacterized lipoprotein
MKKLLFGALMLSFLSACNSDNVSNQTEGSENTPAISGTALQRGCASEEIESSVEKQFGTETEIF